MNATSLALLASLSVNVLFVWAWKEARYNAVHYRRDRDHWHDRAIYWRTLFDDLRRNSIVRNPRTGRYVKGYIRHDD